MGWTVLLLALLALSLGVAAGMLLRRVAGPRSVCMLAGVCFSAVLIALAWARMATGFHGLGIGIIATIGGLPLTAGLALSLLTPSK